MMGILTDFKNLIGLQKKEMELQSLAVGINSSVDFTKDLHIVMLDYDIADLDLVIESVREVQEFWKLGESYIIKTKNGHHAYFFNSIVPYGRLKMIIEYARYVDPMYKMISKLYDHKTLRVAGKYKDKDLVFVKHVPSKYVRTDYEFDIGSMKKKEFEQLAQIVLP